jgi:prohibitin 2
LAVFRAEADGISAVNLALAAANQNPQLVELKRLDVERVKAERWDGKLPIWVTGGEGMMLNVQDGPK